MSRTEFEERYEHAKIISRGLVGPSPCELAAWIDAVDRGWLDRLFDAMTPTERMQIAFTSWWWLRPKQRPPVGDWVTWLLLGGRGSGKSAAASQWVVDRIASGRAKTIALVGPTWLEIERWMVGGKKRRVDGYNGSGLLDVLPPWAIVTPRLDKGELRIRIGRYEAEAYYCSAENPEFRGANTDTIWGDEPIKWAHPRKLFENVYLTLREKHGIAGRPQMVVSTTGQPVQWLRDMIADETTRTTILRQVENTSNLDEAFLARSSRLEGTVEGARELGEDPMVDDDDSTGFRQSTIDTHRVHHAQDYDHVVIAVDPASSTTRKSDKVGIVAVARGKAASTRDADCFVLADKTEKLGPEEWGDIAIELAITTGADEFLVETNKYGDLAAANLRAAMSRRGRTWKIERVHSQESKGSRALPIVGLYSRGRVHHMGKLARLEEEMTDWNLTSETQSPNGADCVVHGVTYLLGLNEEQVDYRGSMAGLAVANAALATQSRSSGGGTQRLAVNLSHRRIL